MQILLLSALSLDGTPDLGARGRRRPADARLTPRRLRSGCRDRVKPGPTAIRKTSSAAGLRSSAALVLGVRGLDAVASRPRGEQPFRPRAWRRRRGAGLPTDGRSLGVFGEPVSLLESDLCGARPEATPASSSIVLDLFLSARGERRSDALLVRVVPKVRRLADVRRHAALNTDGSAKLRAISADRPERFSTYGPEWRRCGITSSRWCCRRCRISGRFRCGPA